MRILGLIPARGGSKGVPGKNKRLLSGKPLIAYTIEAALQSKRLDYVMVSTDDATIATIAEGHGAQVPVMRPADLATDKSPSIDAVEHAVRFFEFDPFDAVCLLQPTVPFRQAGNIDEAIAKFEEAGTDSLVSVAPIPHQYNPHWAFEQDDTGNLRIVTGEDSIITRRQDLPKAWHRDGSIYLTKTRVILEQKSLFGSSIAGFESSEGAHINIDTEADWQAAEAWLAQHER